MMNNTPYWHEIWDNQTWEMFKPRAAYSRTYYKVRSVIRTVIWLPTTVVVIIVALGVLR